MSLIIAYVTPQQPLIPVGLGTSDLLLGLVGGADAYAGGEPVLKAVLSVTFRGVLAMPLMAGIGVLLEASP